MIFWLPSIYLILHLIGNGSGMEHPNFSVAAYSHPSRNFRNRNYSTVQRNGQWESLPIPDNCKVCGKLIQDHERRAQVPTCLHSAHHECMTNMLENFANCPHCMKMLFGNKINQVMEIHDMAKSICDSNKKLYLYILGLSVFSLFLVLEKFF
ncbi:hypothetical protein PGT21_018450 [Puccinia graminis f. sp. tritici]|uniref:RING-type domain-containing protein n=1 Tax=Puccinia graminis f. sp. tritici TaxID=56615 RepID=A0A5B0LMY0_PUCGR|nr:hypothetical protein PGT21_018450 [Puccinia graminis f. sp. tritici]